jgi:hypothetical protein
VVFPDRSTILGATKLTGKLGGWNIGSINALTAREFAEIGDSAGGTRQEVEPFSYYGVLRVQKDIDRGGKGIGFMATGVVRDLRTAALEDTLNENALSMAVDGWTRIHRKTASAELRFDWTLSPRLSVQAYFQPFIGVGAYDRFKELARPKEHAYNVFGEGTSTVTFGADAYAIDPDGVGPATAFSFANPDFNVKSLRGTAVLRWEYLPGSLFYLVWTQNRADDSHPGDFRFRRDFGDMFGAPGENTIMLKLSYRWNR